MSASLFGVPEGSARAFGRRLYRILEDRDVKGWGEILPTLQALQPRPYLHYDGRLSVERHPLSEFEWHLPPTHAHPVLTPAAVPESELGDLDWLLMHAVLMTCRTQTMLWTKSFGYTWRDDVVGDELLKAEGAREQYERLSTLLFQHSQRVPNELWFLASASHLHSYVPADAVAQLADDEDRVGLLVRLARRYRATGDGYLGDMARDLMCLRHVLGLASARAEALFLCYGVE